MRPLALAALSVALASACDKIDYLEIKPEAVILKQPSNEVWMQAKAMSQGGQQAPRAAIAWSVKDPLVASIDPKGRVKPLKSGHTEIVATHSSVTASVPVDVLYVEKVEANLKEATLVEGGDPIELKAKAFDYKGRELRDRLASFKSSDSKIVSMGQNAAFGLAPGAATVEVQVDGVSTSVKFTVEAEKKNKK